MLSERSSTRGFDIQCIYLYLCIQTKVIPKIKNVVLRPSNPHAVVTHKKSSPREAPLAHLSAIRLPPSSNLAGIQL